MIKLTLERAVYQNRRAYEIKTIEVDGRRVREQLLRTPDGELYLTEGDIYFAAQIPDILKDMIIASRDWSGQDVIAIDKLPD